jgi:hypothetical protein
LALVALILSIFGILTGFIFLPLPLLVLLALVLLHQFLYIFLSVIIAWDIYVVPGYPLLSIMVFWEMCLVMFL